MGEIAEMMLEGMLCECCGEYMGDGDGYPMRCAGCRSLDDGEVFINNNPKVKCNICGKRVKAVGLTDHMKAKHEIEDLTTLE